VSLNDASGFRLLQCKRSVIRVYTITR
jgi:hypothetical protein